MTDSMSEMLRQDMQCEGLLGCFHDPKEMDKAVFRLLNETDQPLTVDEVAEEIDRERSTAYRSVQRLMQAGLVLKEQVNYDQGGNYHVHRPWDAEEITQETQRMPNDWCAKMGQLIGEFGEKYADEPGPSVPVEG
ncbi:transcriptional regulator [Halobacteriales archaeon QS_9_68_17]|nr:MAG: transcriptional regulator [Halobacteriales archaeon QS_9_68_17]